METSFKWANNNWGSSNLPGTISKYQRLPNQKDIFLAYVVAIRDPLNFHLDIYWPPEVEARYKNTLKYNYEFVSEELGTGIYSRTAYHCHLKGVEINTTCGRIDPGLCPVNTGLRPVLDPDPKFCSEHISGQLDSDFYMKEAYIYMSTKISSSNGWILVSVSDIDTYKRILVNIFDLIDRNSLNNMLLEKVSLRTGINIAKRYIRPPYKNRFTFQPSDSTPKDYHIVYGK